MRLTGVVVSTAALLGLGACGHAAPGAASPVPAPGSVPRSSTSHVVVLVMENKEYSDLIGNGRAPYLNALSRRYALARRAFAITHPSLPNYIALTAGSTLGVTSDCTGCHFAARNLVDQLEAARISWKAYMDGMPHPCFRGATAGSYAKRHDPFIYYDDVARNPGRCGKIVPGTQLGRDLGAGRLPTFAWVSPDVCEDTHDCSIATGDRYLRRVVPSLLKGLGPHGYLVVTWDEGTSTAGCCSPRARGGHIVTLIAGPDVRRGARLAAAYTHYSTLRTIEDSLGLGRLRAADLSQTRSLAAAFVAPARVRGE